MKKLFATNINWDIDERNETKLPESIPIPEGMEDEDQISDHLSDQTGYCHKGFNLTWVEGEDI